MSGFSASSSDDKPIDRINQRVLQLHGVFGVVRTLTSLPDMRGVDLCPGDLGNLAWLIDDLLDEINEQADALHAQLSAKGGA